MPVAMMVPWLTRDHHPVTEVTGTGDRIVYVRQRDVRDRSGDHVLVAVGQDDLPMALERDAVLDQLQVGLASGRVQLDRTGVVDDAGERQDRTVADHHVAGILRDRRLIEDKVVCGERRGIDPVQRDRLAIGERDHRVAGSVVDRVRLDVAEAGEVGIADQIDLI